MRHVLSGLCVGIAAFGLIFGATAAEKKVRPKFTIKQAMKDHKGQDAPVNHLIDGKASKQELAKFLAYYESMSVQKPPKGDADSWKSKTGALVDATKALIEGKEGAAASFKAAVNCKACHEAHK